MTDRGPDRIRELQAKAQKTLGLVARQRDFYAGFMASDYPGLGRGRIAAAVFDGFLAGLLSE